MKRLIEYLILIKEIQEERETLRDLGLTDKEIDGFIEHFIENFITDSPDRGNN